MNQRGYMFPDFSALLWAGIVIGVLGGGILAYAIPWLWRLIKPWLHAVTG